MKPDEEHRLQGFEARVLALGSLMIYVFQRLGASPDRLKDWHDAWNGGDLTRLYAAINAMLADLPAPPRRTPTPREPAPRSTGTDAGPARPPR